MLWVFFTGVGTERQYERNGTPVKMNVIELEADGYLLFVVVVVVLILSVLIIRLHNIFPLLFCCY